MAPYTTNMEEAPQICLSCGDNRAEDMKAICQTCCNEMQMGGNFRGSEL